MIGIRVKKQIVSVQETVPLYAGTSDVHRCHFSFDKSWDGFSKTAVFRVGAATHTELIGEDDCCTLPWELLTRRNIGRKLEVGVYGVSADTEILTSVWDTLGMIREGSEPGTDARNPVDGIYEQIMAKLQRIMEALGVYDDEGIQATVRRAETAAQLAGSSAAQAAAALEELKKLLESLGDIPDGGGESAAAQSEYCIELGTVVYSSDAAQELTVNFTQSYESEPVFIVHANHAALRVTAEPMQMETGCYGGRLTVTNESGEHITATVSVSAYCREPVGEESENE